MERLKNIAVVLLLAIFAVSLCLNVHFYTRGRVHLTTTDTIRVTIFDTIPFREPAPKRSTLIGIVTDKLPTAPKPTAAAREDTDSIPAINAPRETTDSIPAVNGPSKTADSVDVAIPITQRVYEDSLYTAYVSGYNSKLDSIIVYPRRETMTITNKYTPPKPKRWSVGIQVGYGVTLKGNTPQMVPYFGIGVSYSIFSF